MDRLESRSTAEFETMIEAVRAGTIFAHDSKAAARWQRATASKGQGLTGEKLEGAVMRLAQTNPEYVVVGS